MSEQTTQPSDEAAGGQDVAEENRRRMREALERKQGVHHPDDRGQRGTGVQQAGPPAAARDFSRRRSG